MLPRFFTLRQIRRHALYFAALLRCHERTLRHAAACRYSFRQPLDIATPLLCY